MKSKEEIEQLGWKFYVDKDGIVPNTYELDGYIKGYTQCQEAMVKNQIRFAEWIVKEGIKPSCSEGFWLIIENDDDVKHRLTSKELYERFINSLNKQDNENTRRNRKVG